MPTQESTGPKAPRETAWGAAVRICARWLDRRERIDLLMDSLPADLPAPERARCQHLFYGVVRHFGRIEAAVMRHIAHPPRFPTRAILHVAGFELVEAQLAGESGSLAAKIVHHAVDRAKELTSAPEARLVNAVARRAAETIAAQAPPGAVASAASLSEYFSHPEWLVQRWLPEFGAAPVRKLLEWNQTPAPVHARWRGPAGGAPAWLVPTAHAGFYGVPPGRWPEVAVLLEAGLIYLQDPGTRLSVELLAPGRGEAVLDLCASPGGKSLMIADAMQEGRLVAVDLPDSRIDRLKENLSRLRGVEAALVQGDVVAGLPAILAEHRLPRLYDAILVDVPCSNTGVMRHRVDVKWRLEREDFAKHGRQQSRLLGAAAQLLAPGGRLVYSTCSIDRAENEEVVQAFVRRNQGFRIEKSAVAVPWIEGHDGAAAFLLRRAP
ncbi:MAG TPA: RsmB/NOP family class I SAM-dependent RNA methyltransferase [Opitutaceae bacterium]